MAKLEARCHSENFEFLRRKCPVFDALNNYEDIDYEGLRIASTTRDILSSLKIKDFECADEREANRELSEHIVSHLLVNDCSLIHINSAILEKTKKIERNYQNVSEEFSQTLDKWLKSRKESILALQKSEKKFRLIHRTTTSLAFISSTVEFAVSLGLILKNMFRFELDTKLPLIIVPVLGGISITSSLLALSYCKTTLEDISRGLRDEKHLQRDLERVYRKGKWIDRAVQELFPFGIDLNLLENTTLEKESWRHHLCSAIILTNVKKDIKVFDDGDFLPTVKAFVESPAAQIWFNRMKMRKLLDAMSSECDTLSDKAITSGGEVFLSGAAFCLYPVYFPMFGKTKSTETMRFIFSSIAAVRTAMDLADSEADEFKAMRDTSLALKEEYKRIRKMNTNLASDYD